MVTISTPAGGVTALSNLFINIQDFSRHNTAYKRLFQLIDLRTTFNGALQHFQIYS